MGSTKVLCLASDAHMERAVYLHDVAVSHKVLMSICSYLSGSPGLDDEKVPGPGVTYLGLEHSRAPVLGEAPRRQSPLLTIC